jgi:hypothetical protein
MDVYSMLWGKYSCTERAFPWSCEQKLTGLALAENAGVGLASVGRCISITSPLSPRTPLFHHLGVTTLSWLWEIMIFDVFLTRVVTSYWNETWEKRTWSSICDPSYHYNCVLGIVRKVLKGFVSSLLKSRLFTNSTRDCSKGIDFASSQATACAVVGTGQKQMPAFPNLWRAKCSSGARQRAWNQFNLFQPLIAMAVVWQFGLAVFIIEIWLQKTSGKIV